MKGRFSLSFLSSDYKYPLWLILFTNVFFQNSNLWVHEQGTEMIILVNSFLHFCSIFAAENLYTYRTCKYVSCMGTMFSL